ncbi:hypothetical protein J6590_070131 [Homalodisca vitripennis]|nr:hypothetical protein J6590_070131 [Homalodisca vitripennis]
MGNRMLRVDVDVIDIDKRCQPSAVLGGLWFSFTFLRQCVARSPVPLHSTSPRSFFITMEQTVHAEKSVLR